MYISKKVALEAEPRLRTQIQDAVIPSGVLNSGPNAYLCVASFGFSFLKYSIMGIWVLIILFSNIYF